MKIVIFSGGTGSRAIQKGLFDKFGKNSVEYSVLINAYDNGLSTGVVRQVADGKILGPSDLRKNQCLRHELMYGKTDLLKFLEKRITAKSADEMRESITRILAKMVDDVEITHSQHLTLLESLVVFFRQPNAALVDYTDFSIANILYAGLAISFGNSLEKAGWTFAEILEIPRDSVILNSDESLFLSAETQKGNTILDEGDIVEWNNSEDKIVRVLLRDRHGTLTMPQLGTSAANIVSRADLIILSPGTQWSSLIPTYLTEGMYEMIEDSEAKKILVMNVAEDKDGIGVDAHEWWMTLGKYIPRDQFDILTSESASPIMQMQTLNTSKFDLSTVGETVHDGVKLVRTIFDIAYKDFTDDKVYVFDYDDTLVGRGNLMPRESYDNIDRLVRLGQYVEVVICSGNEIKAIKGFENSTPRTKGEEMRVYADNGINEYNKIIGDTNKAVKIDNDDSGVLMTNEQVESILDILYYADIPATMVKNRGNAAISIKPIHSDYRDILRELLGYRLRDMGLVVKKSGRTTIEISMRGADKGYTIRKLLEEGKEIVYIGDELYVDGNDECVLGIPKVLTVPVRDPKDTNMLLRVLGDKFK